MEDNALLWKWQKNKIYSSIGPGRGGGGRSYNALLTATGNGTGVATLRYEVSANMTLTLNGTARFYTDAAGTLGESTTWTVTAGALQTIYLKCPSGTANLFIPDPSLIIKWGNDISFGWEAALNAPLLTLILIKLTNSTYVTIGGKSVLLGAFSDKLIVVSLSGADITWKCACAFSATTTYIYLGGALIEWTYSGALSSNVTFLGLSGNKISWTHSGALPTRLTFLTLSGALINWTGLDIGNNGNIATLSLTNYRIAKMSSADMVTLLTQMTNRTGTLPKTITINDYADALAPPIEVTNAVTLLKSTKSVTTVTLGA